MADKIKPLNVERVKTIREWEGRNNFKEAKDLPGFTLYKNYYVPESVVKNSKTVLSFGVGGNVAFHNKHNKCIRQEGNILCRHNDKPKQESC